MKLGELLVEEGVITREQLDEALKCHVIFGVKLGSSLIGRPPGQAVQLMIDSVDPDKGDIRFKHA